MDIENDNGNDGLLVLGKKSFKQYSRLTVVLDSPNQMHSLVIYMEKIIGVIKLLIYGTFRIQEVLLLKVMIYLQFNLQMKNYFNKRVLHLLKLIL